MTFSDVYIPDGYIPGFDEPNGEGWDVATPATKNKGTGLNGYLGMAKLGLGALNLGLGYKQYGLAKDAFAYNKMARDRDYAANALKYNNALARTNAVQAHYGLGSVANKLKS